MSSKLRIARVPLEAALTDGPNYIRTTKAADLPACLIDPAEMERQEPSHPKPNVMIDRLRIVGDDVMTAKDAALYELMLAWARRDNLLKGAYEIDGEAVRSYLRLERWADVNECVSRLGTVRVSFDVRDDMFRRAGTVPLVVTHTKTKLAGGVAAVCFEFPTIIRKILAGDQFEASEVDLAPFPRFASKYGSRLYGLLAARVGSTWSVTPSEIAELLGWKASPLHVGMLKKRVVMPALDDVQRHALRLDVEMMEIHSKGRGRPVESFTFQIRAAGGARLERTKTVPMGAAMAERMTVGDWVHGSFLMPGIAFVGQQVRLLDPIRPFQRMRKGTYRLTPDDAVHSWLRALDEARRGLNIGIIVGAPTERSIHGKRLLALIEAEGVNEAFCRFIGVEWQERRFLSALAKGRSRVENRDLALSMGVAEAAHVPTLKPIKTEDYVSPFVDFSEFELDQGEDEFATPAVDDHVEPDFPGDRLSAAPAALDESDEIPF